MFDSSKYISLFALLLISTIFIVTSTALPIANNDDKINTFEKQHRFPNIISSPLIKLLGDTCYETLLDDFHITDITCLKLAISKGLGLGIVVGGAIVKIPQIITILKHRSAQGLSLASFLLETTAYQIVLIYNTRLDNPFSTYGEVLFMVLQNIVICVLILYYEPTKNNNLGKTAVLLCGFSAVFLVLKLVPGWVMSLLYAAQIPIGLASKVPQIRANYLNKSTGQLSVFAVLNYFAGTTARAFTTWTELDDPIMLGGNLLASVLNGVLVFQLILYWEKNKPVGPLFSPAAAAKAD